MDWLKQALTGADNETVAIGRLIGMAIAIVLLIVLPVTATATVVMRSVPVTDWGSFFGTLGLYVLPVAGAIGGLIYGTNFTEPKPKDPNNG